MVEDLHFFLIDDDLDDHDIFMDALTEINPSINCLTAKDGSEALEYLKKDDAFIPDFIFLDLNMPKVTGKECLKELVKIKKLKSVPIYIYTTSAIPKDKEETVKAGAKDLIIKPTSIKKLGKILSEIILTKETGKD